MITRTDPQAPVVLDRPQLYDISVMTYARTVCEAMLHSFAYGSMIVFSSNWALADVDRSVAYIVTGMAVFMACMWMCHVSTNGIHVVTSHPVHFAYYSFAFASFALFQRPPGRGWLVVLYSAWLIGSFTFYRFYTVRRTIIAGIWVAFFQECQQCRANRCPTTPIRRSSCACSSTNRRTRHAPPATGCSARRQAPWLALRRSRRARAGSGLRASKYSNGLPNPSSHAVA